MAANGEFRLPDTPPQGHVFPPPLSTQAMASSKSETESIDKHSRKPSLTINTRELSTQPPQQTLPPPPPPPPRSQAHAPGKPRSHSQPLRPLQATAANLPSPPARKRDSTGTRPLSTTPTHRSIFPQYDPAAPAGPEANNSGICRGPSPQPPQGDFQSTYRQTIYSTARSPPMQHGSLSQAFAAPTETNNCPLPSYRESMYGVPVVVQSTPNDVIDLWCLANGQDDQELALSYNLGLDCTDLELNHELICLTSTAGAVYALRATNNALNIMRTHPLNGASTMSISAPTLYSPSDNSSLLTTVFPVLAKIRAIDQAASVAISQALTRSQALAQERQYITRAHANTAAPVMWNKQTKSWYISLPHYSSNADDLDVAPAHHILPIEINPGVSIRVLEPPSAQSTTNPILTLSLPAKTLIVHSHALAGLPTPYGVDILISALMVLILHLHRQEALFSPEYSATPSSEPVPTFAPPPLAGDNRSGRSTSRTRNPRDRSASRARAGSRLGNILLPLRSTSSSNTNTPTTEHPPHRAQTHLGIHHSNSRAASRLSTHSAAATTLHGSPSLMPPSTPALEKGLDQQLSDRGTAPELNPRVTGLDLSRFQAYDLKDPRLGVGTRGLLRLVYWMFGISVWVLGVSVGILAEMIVVVGNCAVRPAKK